MARSRKEFCIISMGNVFKENSSKIKNNLDCK